MLPLHESTHIPTPPPRTTSASGSARTAELAWVRLMRIYQKLQRDAARVSQAHGLSLSRFDVLNHAGVRDGRTQQELADALFVTKGNICQLLDGMEADGLLRRRKEGRANRITLTERGRELRATILAEQQAALATRFTALSAAEQHSLHQLLTKLDRGLQ